MKKIIYECDGCDRDLNTTEEGIPLLFHELHLDFKTKMRDPNTNMDEYVSNLSRKTKAVYCDDCFMILTNKLQEFLQVVSPGHDKKVFEVIKDESIANNQSSAIDDRLENVAQPKVK